MMIKCINEKSSLCILYLEYLFETLVLVAIYSNILLNVAASGPL